MISYYNVANKEHTDLDKLDLLVKENGIHHAFAEYAARVCYKSTNRAGTSKAFVQKLIDSNHMDVFEHSDFGFWLEGYKEQLFHRYIWNFSPEDGSDELLVTGSSRVFYELMKNGMLDEWQVNHLKLRFPALFGQYKERDTALEYTSVSIEPITSVFGMKVYLLGGFGYQHSGDKSFGGPLITRATWLIEGVSRNMTHQLVRHRQLSFSQESQRYVSAGKGGWDIVTPIAIVDHKLEKEYIDHYVNSMELYDKLYKAGVKKEDARYVLPSGITSRLVVSGPITGLEHFFEQRIDTAAQWEIRDAAIAMFTQLNALKHG